MFVFHVKDYTVLTSFPLFMISVIPGRYLITVPNMADISKEMCAL